MIVVSYNLRITFINSFQLVVRAPVMEPASFGFLRGENIMLHFPMHRQGVFCSLIYWLRLYLERISKMLVSGKNKYEEE